MGGIDDMGAQNPLSPGSCVSDCSPLPMTRLSTLQFIIKLTDNKPFCFFDSKEDNVSSTMSTMPLSELGKLQAAKPTSAAGSKKKLQLLHECLLVGNHGGLA